MELITRIKRIYEQIQNLNIEFITETIKDIETNSYPYKDKNSEEYKLIDDFIETLIALIVELDNDIEKCVEKLQEQKIDKLFITKFLNYAERYAEDIISCRVLNEISKDNFGEICKFLLNRTVITRDFNNRQPSELFAPFGDVKEENAKNATLFLRNYMFFVAFRAMLPDTVDKTLRDMGELNDDKITIFVKMLEENIERLYQFALFQRLENVAEIFDSIDEGND